MIRRFCLLFLLASTGMASAQPLYKWYEADGSITFSPRLPPAGTRYETVTAGSSAADATASTSAAVVSQVTPSAEPPVSAPALPGIIYAPASSQDLPQAISRPTAAAAKPTTGPNPSDAVSAGNGQPAGVPATRQPAADMGAASYKQSRCQDLAKRVTSLERRLKSRLTPEDMDNTVVHMARYQRSYDQYCVQ